MLLQKTMIEDFLTHRLVRNKGQLPQYYVENAHPPIVPKAVFERAKDELWLRANHGKKGGMRFGSRTALKGRTYCGCGKKMKLLRRNEPVFACEGCGREAPESDVKAQVLAAIRALPDRESAIRDSIDANADAMNSEDPCTRALARRRDWYLHNLLAPEDRLVYRRECADEDDFRERTRRKVKGWNENSVVRILAKVVVGVEVVFKGEITVPAGNRRD